MIYIGIKLLDIFLWIWSHFPALCLSDDNNFGTLKYENIKKGTVSFRFSIVSPMLGDRVVYILSIKILPYRGIKIVDIIRLSEYQGILLTNEKLSEIQEKYKIHLDQISDDDLSDEREKLQYHIGQEQHRIDTSLEKVNAYSAIILTIIPIALTVTDIRKIWNTFDTIFVLWLLIGYVFLNIFLLIFRTLEVQGISLSSFGDLRSSTNKRKEINVQFQYDWQKLKYKATHFVCLVENLQNWIISLLFLMLFLYVSPYFSEKNIGNLSEGNIIIKINAEEVNVPYTQSSKKLYSLLLDLEEKRIEQLVIMSLMENLPEEIQKLTQYNDTEIIYIQDIEMDINEIRIIEVE